MRRLFKTFFKIFSIFWITIIIAVLYNAFSNDGLNNSISPVLDEEEWSVVNDSLLEHNRNWKSFDGRKYSLNYQFPRTDLYQSKALKAQIKKKLNYDNYWGSVYHNLVINDEKLLKPLIQKLDSVRKIMEFDRQSFADFVVSFVQDIPYVLILQGSCKDPNYQALINEIGRDKPCVGNVEFGVKTPLEFLTSLSGDCDTRTVLLFALLKYYRYDVAILVSEQYGHSILGVNLPNYGMYKEFLGKKYKVWETTAYGFKMGELSPSVNNLNYWEIVLIS